MSEFFHNDIIDNWNQIADFLDEGDSLTFRNLPRLNEEGICVGLSFLLAEFIKRDKKDDFYKLFKVVSEINPHILASRIANSHPQERQDLDELIDCIYRIHIFQKKQNTYNYDETESDQSNVNRKYSNFTRIYTFAPNHDRLGEGIKVPNQDFSLIQNHEFNQLASLIESLGDNESYPVSIINQKNKKDPKTFHCILIYKSNGKYYVFDANNGTEITCKNPIEAAAEVIGCSNNLFTNYTKKYTLLDKCRERSKVFTLISLLLFPITLCWMLYDELIAKPLTKEQLNEKPLSDSIWLAWGKVKNTETKSSTAAIHMSIPVEASTKRIEPISQTLAESIKPHSFTPIFSASLESSKNLLDHSSLQLKTSLSRDH